MAKIKEEYHTYGNNIKRFDRNMVVYESSYDLEDGCYYQLFDVELDDVFYNISFICTGTGRKSFQVDVSKQDNEDVSAGDLAVLIFLIEEFSSEDFPSEYIHQKCNEAVDRRDNITTMNKDFYFSNEEGKSTIFTGLLK